MKWTNKYNLPKEVCEAIEMYDQSEYSTDPKRIRVSDLVNPPYQRQLLIRYHADVIRDYAEVFPALFGTGFHLVMERISGHERLIEERMSTVVDGILVVGKPDIYDADGTITDYKTTKAWALVFNDRVDWETRLNCYAHILRCNGFLVSRLKALCAYRDWNEMNSMQSADYPQAPSHYVDLKLWAPEMAKEYVDNAVRVHTGYNGAAIGDVPMCSDAERWKTEDKWAVYKSDTHKRALRVLETEMLAKAFASQNGLTRIEKRAGEYKKCMKYCNVRSVCPFGKTLATSEESVEVA